MKKLALLLIAIAAIACQKKEYPDLIRIEALPAGYPAERFDRLGFTAAGSAGQPYPNALQRIFLLNLSTCCDPE